jgi:hypothetical protein
MLTPRATWLEEPHSVESDLSHSLSSFRAPPGSGPMPNGRLLRRPIDFRRRTAIDDPEGPSSHPMARFRRTSSMSGMRSVVSCEEHLRVPRTSREMALTPSSSRSHTRSRRSLPARIASRQSENRDHCRYRYAMRRHRVGDSVARSAGGHPRLATRMIGEPEMCTTDVCPTLKSSGTLIRAVSAHSRLTLR